MLLEFPNLRQNSEGRFSAISESSDITLNSMLRGCSQFQPSNFVSIVINVSEKSACDR